MAHQPSAPIRFRYVESNEFSTNHNTPSFSYAIVKTAGHKKNFSFVFFVATNASKKETGSSYFATNTGRSGGKRSAFRRALDFIFNAGNTQRACIHLYTTPPNNLPGSNPPACVSNLKHPMSWVHNELMLMDSCIVHSELTHVWSILNLCLIHKNSCLHLPPRPPPPAPALKTSLPITHRADL